MRDFESAPSLRYTAAVAALQAVAADEGVEQAKRAYADALADSRRRLWQAMYGLHPMPGDVHDLTDGACPWRESLPRYCMGQVMPSCGFHLDHGALWGQEGLPRAFVGHVYGLDSSQLMQLASFCVAHGLEVATRADQSWWFPGWSLAVIITRLGRPLAWAPPAELPHLRVFDGD